VLHGREEGEEESDFDVSGLGACLRLRRYQTQHGDSQTPLRFGLSEAQTRTQALAGTVSGLDAILLWLGLERLGASGAVYDCNAAVYGGNAEGQRDAAEGGARAMQAGECVSASGSRLATLLGGPYATESGPGMALCTGDVLSAQGSRCGSGTAGKAAEAEFMKKVGA